MFERLQPIITEVVEAGTVYAVVADVPTDSLVEFLNVLAMIYPNAIARAKALLSASAAVV